MPKVFEDKSGNKGHIVKSKNIGHKTKVPFVVYADFESLLKKVHQPQTREQPKGASVEHEPFSCAFYVQCSFDSNQSEFKTYRGPDPGIWLAEELQKLGRAVEILYNNKIDMPPLSPEEEEKFQSAPLCHICEKPFQPSDTRVHDHNHLTGKKFTKDDCSHPSTLDVNLTFSVQERTGDLLIRTVTRIFEAHGRSPSYSTT